MKGKKLPAVSGLAIPGLDYARLHKCIQISFSMVWLGFKQIVTENIYQMKTITDQFLYIVSIVNA
jgi:hypothetical protein